MEPRKLKRAIIKEELVALTGDFKKAIILNQFIYWSERVKDAKSFMEEELVRMTNHGMEIPTEDILEDFQNGWIYKKAEELAEETMLGLSKSNMLSHIKYLVDRGWLDQRTNPKYKWDKTLQYRVNLVKIQTDLQELGYSLEGYSLQVLKQNSEVLTENHRSSETELRGSEIELGSSKTEPQSSEIEPGSSETEPRSSKTEQQYQRLQHILHTENTTNITTDNTTKEEEILQNLLHLLQQKVSKPSFDTWIKDLRFGSLSKDCLTLVAPNPFIQEWLNEHYKGITEEMAGQILGSKIQVVFSTQEE